MLRVSINKKEVNIENRSILKSLGDVMKDVSKNILHDDIITGLRLDGREITRQELKDCPLKEDESRLLEIETSTLAEMKNRGFLLLDEYIKKIIPQMEKASELLRIGDECEANEFYAACIEDLKCLIGLIEDVGSVSNLDYEKIEFSGTPIKERIERFSTILKEMLLSQENDDWIMLADLIEYEMIALLKEWEQITGFIMENHAST